MIEYATITDTGEKEKNEDAVRVFINQSISTYGFVLADGLGGYGNGEVASNFVAECVGATIKNSTEFSNVLLDECFDTSQEMLLEEKEIKGLHSIKTTMVVLIIAENIAQWGHIGDSRLYHFRNGKQMSRTIDHSVPQLLAKCGKIKEKEIRHHPDRSVLLRAMGIEWESSSYEIDQRNMCIEKGDTFILCSDGFWEWIDEKNMTKILKKDLSAYDTLNEMVKEVKNNGIGKDMDNYSAILVNIK